MADTKERERLFVETPKKRIRRKETVALYYVNRRILDGTIAKRLHRRELQNKLHLVFDPTLANSRRPFARDASARN